MPAFVKLLILSLVVLLQSYGVVHSAEIAFYTNNCSGAVTIQQVTEHGDNTSYGYVECGDHDCHGSAHYLAVTNSTSLMTISLAHSQSDTVVDHYISFRPAPPTQPPKADILA